MRGGMPVTETASAIDSGKEPGCLSRSPTRTSHPHPPHQADCLLTRPHLPAPTAIFKINSQYGLLMQRTITDDTPRVVKMKNKG